MTPRRGNTIIGGLAAIVFIAGPIVAGIVDGLVFNPRSPRQIVNCSPYKGRDDGETGLSGKQFKFDFRNRWRIYETGEDILIPTGRQGVVAKKHDIMYVPDNSADEYATHECTGFPDGVKYVKVEKMSG